MKAKIDNINKYAFLKQKWLQLILLIGAFVFAYVSVFPYLIKTWNRADYSHGFLIPLISGYLIWVKRESLRELPIQPNLMGIFVMAIAGFILIMGKVGSVKVVQELTLILMIIGLSLTFLGTKYLKSLFLPIAYLLLMVPIFDQFIDHISWPLQLFSARFATEILSYLGIPVFNKMQYIETPYIKFEIIEACSGFRYLISIFAIAIPLAYYTQKKRWRRGAVLVSAVIIGIIANSVRVAFVVTWSYFSRGYYDTHGPLHIFQGLFVSIIGLFFLFIGTSFFNETSRSDQKKSHEDPKPVAANINFDLKRFNPSWILAMVILIGLGSYSFLYNPTPTKLKKDLRELPGIIGNWQWIETNPGKIYKIHGADVEVTRLYRNQLGQEIVLHIGYFEFQTQDKEAIYYKNKWLYKKVVNVEIPIHSQGSITVNKTIVASGDDKNSLIFWYDLNGRIITNKYYCKFLSALDGLIRSRNNIAVVIVSSNLGQRDEIQGVSKEQEEFVTEILPVLKNYLPS
jgi:EpsI family protein